MPELDNATLQSLTQLRKHLEQLIESNDKRYEQRDRYQQEALRLALETNNRRLDTMNEFRKALGLAIFILFVLIAGMCTIIGLKIDSSLSGLNNEVTQNKVNAAAATATTTMQLIEVETQFKNLSHALNDLKDQNQRIDGLLWKRVYNEVLPPTDYRPNFFKDK